MDLHTDVSYELAEKLTKRYSTSFSMSSLLFDVSIRRHIYAIYGMVRIADEIVDTYKAGDALERLDAFEAEIVSAIKSQYSTNPIIHAFAHTANAFGIDEALIEPFFKSMRMDIRPQQFDQASYQAYIYGSAEVVGLMCLRIFTSGDESAYEKHRAGAQALGSAYQKVNFLRDIKADYEQLGRTYFPGVSYETFTPDEKQQIVSDIKHDFDQAKQAIDTLPSNSRRAVRASYYYYTALLEKLNHRSVDEIKVERTRISDVRKLALLTKAAIGL